MIEIENLTLDKIILFAVIALFAIIAIYGGYKTYFLKRKYPKCGNLWTRQLYRGSMGENFGSMLHQDYRVFLKCNRCGKIWNIIHTEHFGD